jgi:capsular exopolysaccharide synthesis family protein
MDPSQKIRGVDENDLKQFIQFILRNYKVFLFCLVAAIGLACLVNRFMKPTYKISASLLIAEKTRTSERNVNEFIKSNLFESNRNLQNELWVLKSAPVLEQTVRNLNLAVSCYQKKEFQYMDLYGAAPFRVLFRQNHIQPVNVRFNILIQDQDHYTIAAKGKDVSFINMETGEVAYIIRKWNFEQKGKFGNLMETSDLAFVVELNHEMKTDFFNKPEYSFVLNDISILIADIEKNLSFKIVDKLATVIEIIFKSPSVKKGKDIVNEMINVYSRQDLERKRYIARVTLNDIEEQLNETSDSLRFTEDELQSFRSSNQLLDFTEQASGITAQYMSLEDRLAELRARKRYYDYVSDYLDNHEDFSRMIVPASMGISDQLLNNLMSELITAHAQRSNLIRNNQELNPQVQKLGIGIENLKKTISENINTIQKTTDISIDEMNKRIHDMKATISRMPETQRQLGAIEREYRLNDALFNYLLEKRAEAKINLAFNIPDKMIIEPAKQVGTRPVSPNKQINYLIAVFLGFAVPFSFLTLKNMMTNKIESQETVEQITNLPVVGKIMHNRRKTGNVVSESPGSVVAESYRTLRTNLEYQFKGIQRKVILVTSCMPGEGKSLISQNMAMSYAQLGYHTLLINFDLRKQTDYFKKSEKLSIGISSWYTDDFELDDIIMHSPYEKLDYIQTGPLTVNPTELLSHCNTEILLDQLRTLYDCIIMDTSPLALVSDPYLLMDYADIKIVVVRYNYTSRNVFALIAKDLMQKDIGNVCIVMNDNRSFNNQYGYGYGYRKDSRLDVRDGKRLISAIDIRQDKSRRCISKSFLSELNRQIGKKMP